MIRVPSGACLDVPVLLISVNAMRLYSACSNRRFFSSTGAVESVCRDKRLRPSWYRNLSKDACFSLGVICMHGLALRVPSALGTFDARDQQQVLSICSSEILCLSRLVFNRREESTSTIRCSTVFRHPALSLWARLLLESCMLARNVTGACSWPGTRLRHKVTRNVSDPRRLKGMWCLPVMVSKSEMCISARGSIQGLDCKSWNSVPSGSWM